MKEHLLRLSIAVLLCSFTLATAQNPQTGPQKGTIEGTVTRSGTGQPLKGARVTLRPGNMQERPPMVMRMAAGEGGKFVTTAGGGATATTDGSGRFAFTGVDPGQYRISAERDGFIRSEYGQRTSTGNGVAVTVAANQRLLIDFPMLQASVISGRVLNPDGEPASGSTVAAYTYQYANGQRTLAEVASAQTNDLGEYRLFWLQRGEYFVGLRSNQIADDASHTVDVGQALSGPAAGGFPGVAGPAINLALGGVVNPPVYYPGTIDPDAAAPVTLAAASEVRGLDFSLRSMRTATLSGRIVAPFSLTPQAQNFAVGARQRVAGDITFQQVRFPAAQGQVSLTRIGSGSSELVGTTRLSSTPGGGDGDFEFKGVPPGAYNLTATARDPNGQQFTGRTRVDVGTADVGNVVVTLRAGVTVRGRITLEAAPPQGFKMTQLRVSLVAGDSGSGASGKMLFSGGPGGDVFHLVTGTNLSAQSAIGEVGEDGSFSIQDVGTMEYRVRVTGLPSGAYLQSGRIGSNDALSAPFSVDSEPAMLQLQIGFSSGRISGTITDATGAPAPAAQAVLVPDQARRGRNDAYFSSSSGQNGQFTLNGVPPGSYKLFAWEEIPDGAYQYPDFIRRYEDRGQLVTVGANGSVNADVRLIPAN